MTATIENIARQKCIDITGRETYLITAIHIENINHTLINSL
jgi:hypothetical protein